MWAPNLGPCLFLHCLGGVSSVGPYSEMVHNVHVVVPEFEAHSDKLGCDLGYGPLLGAPLYSGVVCSMGHYILYMM